MENRKNTKEEYEVQKRRYKVSRDKIYENYPQVKKFEASKKKWIGFLFLLGLLLTVVKIYVLHEVSGIPISIIKAFVTSFTPILIFLACALGKWKLAIPLYFLSALYLGQWVYLLASGMVFSLNYFVRVIIIGGFIQYPIQMSVDFCFLVYGILILVTAIRLTLFRKNRELSAQSAELQAKLKEAMSE